MNRNLIIGGIIVLAAIIGVIFYATTTVNSPSTTATSTPTGGTTGQAPVSQQPGAPTVVTSTNTGVSDTTAILTGAVTPNGSFTSYWYEYGTSNSLGSNSSTQTLGSGYSVIQAPAYITGLVKNTTYFYRLVAENQYGTVEGATYSLKTTLNIPAPLGGTPAAQTSSASSVSRTAADLNGTVSPNRAATTYWFEYGTSANLGSITAFTSAGSGSGSVTASAAINGLNPSTTYYFRLDAQNQFGTVNGAIRTFTTPGPAASAEPVVTTQVASPIGTTTATLRGTVNPTNAQTTYWFEYGTDSLLGSVLTKSTPQRSIGAGSDTVAVTAAVTGLRSETIYYYRTVAQNAAGIVRGDRLTFKTN